MDFGDLDQIDPSVFGLGMEDMPVFDYDPIDFSVFEDVFIEPLDISDHIKPPEFGDLRYLNYVKPRPGAGGDTAGTNAAAEETHLSESLLPPDVSQKLDDALEAIVTVVGASENKSEVKAEPDGASESSSKISIPNSQLSTVLREVSCGLHQDLNEDTFGDFFENSTAENDINDVDGEVASERDSNKSFTPKPKFEKREDVVLHTPAASEVFSQEEEPVEPVEATTGKKCDEESLLEKEPTVNDTQDANNNSGEVAENDNEIHDSNGIESEANEPLEKLKPDKTTKAKDNTPPEKVLQERRVTRQQVPQEIKKQGNSGDRPAKMIPIIKKATKRTRPKTIEPDPQFEKGLWVQCSEKKCSKWRFLHYVNDAAILPKKWVCKNNPDSNYNSCSIPEDPRTHADYYVPSHLIVGAIVWAKMPSYPPWPAIIDDDPDTETSLWTEGKAEEEDTDVVKEPKRCHVSFFERLDGMIARAWLDVSNIEPYTRKPYPRKSKKAKKEAADENVNENNNNTVLDESTKKNLRCAIREANKAVDMALIERRAMYCLLTKFKRRPQQKV